MSKTNCLNPSKKLTAYLLAPYRFSLPHRKQFRAHSLIKKYFAHKMANPDFEIRASDL
jgi:hypothetical protein